MRQNKISILTTIASVTVKESFRNKLIGGVAFFGIILIALSNLLSKFTIQEQMKFIKDLGLSGIAFFGQLMAIIAGGTVIADDYEKKTINQVITNPVKPYQYILGRYMGIIIVLLINILLFTVIFYGSILLSYVTNAYREMPANTYVPIYTLIKTQIGTFYSQNIHLLGGIWLVFLQMMMISAIALLLSFFFSKVINFVICIVVFIIGHLTLYMNQFSESLDIIYKTAIRFFIILIPSFEYFNISDYLVLNRLISFRYYLWVMFYAAAYIIPVLLVCMLIFEKKEIK